MKDSKNPFLSAAAVALALTFFALVTASLAHAQTFTVLYNFGGVPGDPQYPPAGPIAQGRDGNLYSTTYQGGSTGLGTVFNITPAGTVTVLHNFGGPAGFNPEGGLTLGQSGNFYGTAANGGSGGYGTVFQIAPEGKLTLLYSFSGGPDGANPFAPPIQGADGNLYGTTSYAGQGSGTIYKITLPRYFTTIYTFPKGSDPSGPYDPLFQASNGYLYGSWGNATSGNTAFKISPAGAFASLGPLPGWSVAPFIQANNGYLYGVTVGGGAHNEGTAFQMSVNGRIRVLHNFSPANDGPYGPYAALVQATDGDLYGVTRWGGDSSDGAIYRLGLDGDFTVLYSFPSYAEDFITLIQHTNGILYGETSSGGLYGGGTFFSLNVGAPPFVRLVSTFGRVGQRIGILGQGFTGAANVSFSGIPANFTVSSDTYLEATVPVGANTGFVTVTSSTGTLTSDQPIQIRQ